MTTFFFFTFKMFQHIYNCTKTLKNYSMLFFFKILPTLLVPNTDVHCSTPSEHHVLFLFIRIDFWVGVATATIVNTGHRAPPPFLLLHCLFLCCSFKPAKMASTSHGVICYSETVSSIQQCMHERWVYFIYLARTRPGKADARSAAW